MTRAIFFNPSRVASAAGIGSASMPVVLEVASESASCPLLLDSPDTENAFQPLVLGTVRPNPARAGFGRTALVLMGEPILPCFSNRLDRPDFVALTPGLLA